MATRTLIFSMYGRIVSYELQTKTNCNLKLPFNPQVLAEQPPGLSFSRIQYVRLFTFSKNQNELQNKTTILAPGLLTERPPGLFFLAFKTIQTIPN